MKVSVIYHSISQWASLRYGPVTANAGWHSIIWQNVYIVNSVHQVIMTHKTNTFMFAWFLPQRYDFLKDQNIFLYIWLFCICTMECGNTTDFRWNFYICQYLLSTLLIKNLISVISSCSFIILNKSNNILGHHPGFHCKICFVPFRNPAYLAIINNNTSCISFYTPHFISGRCIVVMVSVHPLF